jgi:hypothetical protein
MRASPSKVPENLAMACRTFGAVDHLYGEARSVHPAQHANIGIESITLNHWKKTMITRIATGVVAFAAMFAAFAGTAQAEVLEDGKYMFRNNHGGQQLALAVVLTKKGMAGDNGVYEVKVFDSETGEAVGYLSAASSDAGAEVTWAGENATRWQLHQNSNGWNFLHAENGANAVSHPEGITLKLRRNNDGGNGNADQLWQLTQGWK